MPDYYVTDLNHLQDAAFHPEAPAPARRLALYLGRIVEAATAGPSGERIQTPLRCRRRPERKPCAGRLLVLRLDVPREIHWACPSCQDAGQISGWQGGPWDFTPRCLLPLRGEDGEPVAVSIPEAEYRILKEHVITADPETDRVVAAARLTSRGILLEGTADELEDLLGYVTFEANRTRNRRHRMLLNRLADRIVDALPP